MGAALGRAIETLARTRRHHYHHRHATMMRAPMPAAIKSISHDDTADPRKSTTPAPPDAPLIRGMPDLLSALRARRDELQLTHERVGWLSFGLCLDALGVALVMVENPEQIKRVENRWIPRERPAQRTGKHHPPPRLK